MSRRVAGILLAAGRSSRMRGPNKLLLRLKSGTLVGRTADELLKSDLGEIVAVTGHDSHNVEQELSSRPLTHVFNPDYALGMHASIRRGLLALERPCDAFVICLADQPDFDAKILDLMIEGFRRSPKDAIVFPTYRGAQGHPVLISETYRAEILAHPDGDFGCAYLFKKYPENLVGIPVESEHVVIDIDEPKDYLRHGGLDAT